MESYKIFLIACFVFLAVSDTVVAIRKIDYKGIRYCTALISLSMAVYVSYSFLFNPIMSLNKMLFWFFFVVYIILSMIFLMIAIRVHHINLRWCSYGGILALFIAVLLCFDYFISQDYRYSTYIVAMSGIALSSMDKFFINTGVFEKKKENDTENEVP